VCAEKAVLAFHIHELRPFGFRVSVSIYHYSVQVFGRSSGHSAVAAAAYRAGEDLHDLRTGEDHNYARRSGVIESDIIAQDGSPEWVYDRSHLWNVGEQAENRKDAQLAREAVMALPFALTHEQRKELLIGFAQEQYVAKGMIADISFHKPDKNGDHRNYHAHVMLTLRPLDENGGFADKKERDWNKKEVLLEQRKAWAEHMNRALERAGINERVDERSFVDREINRVPTSHMGKEATHMERRGEESRVGEENREAENWNRELAELEQDEKIINLAIEREKRKIAQEQKQKPALALKDKGETLREKTQGFQDPAPLPVQLQNAMELRHLDERRALEAQIDQQKAVHQEFLNRTYEPHSAQQALRDAQTKFERSQGTWAKLSGQHDEAARHLNAMRLNLKDIEQRTQESMGGMEKQAQGRLEALQRQHGQEMTQYNSPTPYDPQKTPTQEREQETEDFREHTPDYRSFYRPAANDNERPPEQIPDRDQGPSLDR